MTDDDNDIGFDLTAWEAPRAPDVADAVIARAREPEARGAVEPVAKKPMSRKLIIGSIAAAVAMVGVVVFAVRGSSEELSGFGAAVADRPSHIDFGGNTSAELDPGTSMIWVRDGHRVVALQPRGAATWRIDDSDTVRIDAGATVASVSASGASLRVEVEMNSSEAKTVGATAIGAATIATLVTVLVYNGRAQVSSNDHAMTVSPGTTVAVHTGEPPADVIGRAAAQRFEIDRLREQLSQDRDATEKLRQRLAEKEREFAALEDSVRNGSKPAGTVNPIKVTLPGACDYDASIKRGDAFATSGAYGSALVEYRAALVCKPKDLSAGRKAYLSACRTKQFAEARSLFQAIGSPMAFAQICMKEGFDPRAPLATAPAKPDPKSPVPPPSLCDDQAKVAQIIKQGEDAMQSGAFGQALTQFDRVLKCSPGLRSKMYLAACRSKNFKAAKVHFQALGSPDSLGQICMKEGFDPRNEP